MNLATGLLTSGQCIGASATLLMGGHVYDGYGFTAPFMVLLGVSTSIITLSTLVLPTSSKPLLTKEEATIQSEAESREATEKEEDDAEEEEDGLSVLLVFAVLAYSLSDLIVGVTTITTVPYMLERFDVSVATSSGFLSTLYFSQVGLIFAPLQSY